MDTYPFEQPQPLPPLSNEFTDYSNINIIPDERPDLSPEDIVKIRELAEAWKPDEYGPIDWQRLTAAGLRRRTKQAIIDRHLAGQQQSTEGKVMDKDEFIRRAGTYLGRLVRSMGEASRDSLPTADLQVAINPNERNQMHDMAAAMTRALNINPDNPDAEPGRFFIKPDYLPLKLHFWPKQILIQLEICTLSVNLIS